MLSSVTVSSVSHAHSHTNSTVLNRVYRIRAKNDDVHRLHKVSTKILGFGVFMIGVVVLAIGLIMGIEFPIHIKEKIVEDNCILNKDHEFYEKWTEDFVKYYQAQHSPTQTHDNAYARHNLVYYWEITNPEDFLFGATPIFEEKGPYVYREKQLRLNVIFKDNMISYRIMFTQSFSESLTKAECGSACTENDEITTINTELLRKLQVYDGWTGYLKAYIPTFVTDVTKWTPSPSSINQHLIDILSCANVQCTYATATQNTTGTSLGDVSFGNYLLQNDTVYKNNVLNNSAFVNSTGYVPWRIIWSLYNQLTSEKHSPNSTHCSNAASGNGVFWKVKINRLHSTTLSNDNTANPSIDSTEYAVYFSQRCVFSDAMLILIDHITKYSNSSNVLWTLHTCSVHTPDCDTIHDTQVNMNSFFHTLNDYIDEHLLQIISDTVLPLHQNSIITTKPQHELAKGYMRRASHNADPYEENREPGILEHQWTIDETFRNSPEVVVGTCLFQDNADNNMLVRKFNGSHFINAEEHTHDTDRVSGYMMDFPPSRLCRACSKPSPVSLGYDVFLRELHRSVKFEYTMDKDRYDNTLYSYRLTKDALRDDISCDLINTTATHGYASFAGRPAFGGSRCEFLTRNLNSRFTDINSEIYIEPRTGKSWYQSIKLQTSTQIQAAHLESVSGRIHPGVSAITTPIPLHWVDRRIEIVESEIDYFEYRIDRLMTVSCGGLIGFVTFSLIIMVFSVFVGLLSTRKNKIHAVPEEPSQNRRG